MIFPEIALDEFLKKYPQLKNEVALSFKEFKNEINTAIPYYNHKSLGVLITLESGRQRIISTPRDSNLSNELAQLFIH